MAQWDREYIDLVEPGFIETDVEGLGALVFGTVRGSIDCRYNKELENPKIEFSWQGDSEGDPVCGRGWAVKESKKSIYGELYIHCGDES